MLLVAPPGPLPLHSHALSFVNIQVCALIVRDIVIALDDSNAFWLEDGALSPSVQIF
jgi:hypothetical protein